MKDHLNKLTKWVVAGVLALVGAMVQNASVMAGGYSLTMAPMNQSIVINPGESFETSFKISNSSNSTQDTYYKVEVEPFYMNNQNEIKHESEGDSGKIVEWVTFNVPTEGKLVPNETKEIVFTINVPESAPAGGQYMSVLVTASAGADNGETGVDESEDDSNTMIREVKRMSHLVYAEVAGNTIKKGEIYDASLPSFLLSGKITGSATVKNVGNVHGEAKYVLKIYPLFSDEEIYTNEEKPASFVVMPDREVYSEIAWEQTPAMGVFNAVFTVEFEGETVEISKLIIVCPVWLLFVILFAIVAIIIWIVMRARGKKRGTN